MFKIIVAVSTAFLALAGTAWAQVHVDGYTRRDGTYVQPHYRSSPNNSYNDNWSVRPNVNPYSGESGRLSPTWDNRPPSNDLFGSGRPSHYGR